MKKLISLITIAILCNFAFAQIDATEIFDKADSIKAVGDRYYKAKRYTEAISFYNEAALLAKKVDNGDNASYVMAIYNMAYAYSTAGDKQNAIKYYILTKDAAGKVYGKENNKYAGVLNQIGIEYYNIGEYKKALEYFIPSMEIRKRILGEDSLEYAKMLNNIGSVYSDMGDYENELKYIQQALEIRKKVLGENHIDYAQSLNNMGVAYNHLGDYKNALKYHLQSLEIKKIVIGTEDPDYIASLINIGNNYRNIGNYQNALEYLSQAMETQKKVLGEGNSSYATTLNNIALVYFDMADYQNALKYHKQAMSIREKTLGKGHPSYAMSLYNIGIVYSLMGDYQNALKYYEQSLEIKKKVLGESHPDYAASLIGVGNVYLKMGDYQNALKYQKQALEIRRKVSGEEHPEYARTLDNIGAIYTGMGDDKNALNYFVQAMGIRKRLLGENHPDYASTLGNIGATYYKLKDYKNALKYQSQSLEIKEKVIGKEHPDYAASLVNIGLVYSDMHDYQNALKCYMQALEIKKKFYGMGHPEYAKALGNIAVTYYYMDDYRNAIKFNKQATDISKNNLIKNFSFMTSMEREAYWNANSKNFSHNIIYLFYSSSDTLARKTSYDTELITKGLLLASEVSTANIIKESGNSALISEYEDMNKMHMQLNKELEKPITERKFDCDSLENQIRKKERHIMESCKEFGDVTNFIKIDWKDVQNSLKKNDVAIEFTNITVRDTTIYAALVLTKDMSAPVPVRLFNDKELRKLIRGTAPTKADVPDNEENRGATSVSTKKLGIYESTELYRILWKKLEGYFPENPRIYFAPSGMLHQVAIEYAPIGNGKTISDKYEIYRVSSTRFLAMDYMPRPLKNSVLYGGIYYDSDTTTMKRESDRYSTRSATQTAFAGLKNSGERSGLNYLPGTKTEVEDIVGKLNKKKVKTMLYEGSQANEESFKALSGKDIEVLHIATHGFFLPSDEKLSGDQSLVQSGLLLSGANYAWQDMPLPEGIEDGILTAKEISFMDLRKTDLVVLSACQTALGEITGEGVFGLQRGFKKAGARTLIMSLWPVDDNATLLMMTEFYSNLTNGMTKRDAFLAAQNKVKTTAGFENPRYWAAFIMLDGNEK